ncbi:hypothetical protein CVIRNUC_005182 [Coccomyxa viridis]|uniref:Uncharacterized protein n=1 Tax=Coccomyxa viridis TaxID=1274662 RepID=A0AAV1I4L0_9CHLO|nr:hypothetical protein CVIRNUC_005182 [Coccomyxa viridis]
MYSWPCRKKVSCLPLLGRPHDPVVTTYALERTRQWSVKIGCVPSKRRLGSFHKPLINGRDQTRLSENEPSDPRASGSEGDSAGGVGPSLGAGIDWAKAQGGSFSNFVRRVSRSNTDENHDEGRSLLSAGDSGSREDSGFGRDEPSAESALPDAQGGLQQEALQGGSSASTDVKGGASSRASSSMGPPALSRTSFVKNPGLSNIQTPFSSCDALIDHPWPPLAPQQLESIAEVDMSARLSSSLPETPASDALRSQLRASYGVVESPLKRHTSGGARPFADDTAKDLSSSGVQRRPGTHTEGVEEAPEAAGNLLTSMRSSRSVPSLASADLTTPRNLIEVSAWLRQHQDHAPASSSKGLLGRVPSLKSKGESLTAKTSSSSLKRPTLSGRASGSSMKGPTLSGKAEPLSTRASSVPSVVSSRGAHHSTNSSGGWDSLEEGTYEDSGEGAHRPGPNPLLKHRLGHVCLPVIDTQIMLVDSIKGCTFVNQYVVVKTLGQGAYGKVKLCLNSEDHNLYALKLVSKGDPRRRPRLTRRVQSEHIYNVSAVATGADAESDAAKEIYLLRSLCHPNIVRLIEVIDDARSTKILLVMEYVEGGPVVSTSGSQRRHLSEAIARKFFRDALQGVDYMHSMGVTHGDIKPDNLLLGADGRVRLCDFGSAQQCGSQDVMIRTVGTPAFFSPEMCDGRPYSARSADVWALGISLYIFVFGALPFQSDAIMRMYDEIRLAPLRFPRGREVSPLLAELLARMLAKDPAERMTLPQIMSHPWITHNGTAPLACLQNSSMPNAVPDQHDSLEALVAVLSPLFEERCYKGGAYLAREGQAADSLIYIEEGEADICFSMRQRPDEDLLDDEEESSEDEAQMEALQPAIAPSPHAKKGAMLASMSVPHLPTHLARGSLIADTTENYARDQEALLEMGGVQSKYIQKRCAHVRHHGLLHTMLQAAQLAAQSVTTARASSAERIVTTTRGPGQFIGEASLFEGGHGDATWKTSVRAKGKVKALLLMRSHLRHLLKQRPEAEAAVRAAMAQRKGELLKLETLERIASLLTELQQDAVMAEACSEADEGCPIR